MSAPPAGNTFDKYGATNPVFRRLTAGFVAAADDLVQRCAPQSLLDVGCGEGLLTERWATRLAPREVVGIDLVDPGLQTEWSRRKSLQNLRFSAMRAEALQFDDGAFDLVVATEVLEHVSDPDAALAQMTRVTRRWLLVSVPREPVWRALNLARGAYVSALGNTPGHLHHWSPASFTRLLARHGEIVARRAPLPWTMLLVSVR